MLNWIEVPAEDGRGNRKTLRLARTQRGIKILAPAADVTHVVDDNVNTLTERLRELTDPTTTTPQTP